MFKHPQGLRVQKVQTNMTTVGRFLFSFSSKLVPTTQPVFTEWKSTIHRFLSPPKILGQKAKSNNYSGSTRAIKKTYMCLLTDISIWCIAVSFVENNKTAYLLMNGAQSTSGHILSHSGYGISAEHIKANKTLGHIYTKRKPLQNRFFYICHRSIWQYTKIIRDHLETMSFCFHSVWIHLRLHSNWMDAAMAEAQIFFDSYHYPNWATGFISQGLVFTCMQCACTLRICSHWTFAKAKAAEQIANMWIGSLRIFLTLLSILISRRGSPSVWMDLKTTILECERGRQLSRKPLRS